MTNFEKALKFTLAAEGGFVNDPKDSGGPTNLGITQKTLDFYTRANKLPRADVKSLTKSQATTIYKWGYWDLAGCDNFDTKTAIALFDFAVNSGVSRAVRLLRASNFDLDKFIEARMKFLLSLNNKRFIKGWINRITKLKAYLETIS